MMMMMMMNQDYYSDDENVDIPLRICDYYENDENWKMKKMMNVVKEEEEGEKHYQHQDK